MPMQIYQCILKYALNNKKNVGNQLISTIHYTRKTSKNLSIYVYA